MPVNFLLTNIKLPYVSVHFLLTGTKAPYVSVNFLFAGTIAPYVSVNFLLSRTIAPWDPARHPVGPALRPGPPLSTRPAESVVARYAPCRPPAALSFAPLAPDSPCPLPLCPLPPALPRACLLEPLCPLPLFLLPPAMPYCPLFYLPRHPHTLLHALLSQPTQPTNHAGAADSPGRWRRLFPIFSIRPGVFSGRPAEKN